MPTKIEERGDFECFGRCGKHGVDKAAHLRVTDRALAEPHRTYIQAVSSKKNGRASRMTFLVGTGPRHPNEPRGRRGGQTYVDSCARESPRSTSSRVRKTRRWLGPSLQAAGRTAVDPVDMNGVAVSE